MPPCRMYFAYARSRVTSRQLSPAVRTRALKPSSSVSPCHSAVTASSKILRTLPLGGVGGALRPNSYIQNEVWLSGPAKLYGCSSTTSRPMCCNCGTVADRIHLDPDRYTIRVHRSAPSTSRTEDSVPD